MSLTTMIPQVMRGDLAVASSAIRDQLRKSSLGANRKLPKALSRIKRYFKALCYELLVLIFAISLTPGARAECEGSNVTTPITVEDEAITAPGSRMLVPGQNSTVNTATPGQISIDVPSAMGLPIDVFSGGGAFAPAANTFTEVTSASQIDLPAEANAPVGSVIGLTIGGSIASININPDAGDTIIFNGDFADTQISVKKGDVIFLAKKEGDKWIVTSFVPQGGADGSTWSAQQGGTGISTVPAKGSLLAGNSDGTAYVNLPVGSNNQVLTADSTVAEGVKWATASGGGGGFGGDGSDGSITISADTTYDPAYKNASSLTIDATKILTVTTNAVLQSSGAVTINGKLSGKGQGYVGGAATGSSSSVGGDGAPGARSNRDNGSDFFGYGGMGGAASTTASAGGGGASSYAAGGAGGHASVTAGRNGYPLLAGTSTQGPSKAFFHAGAGGGAGGVATGAGGNGGAGGGKLLLLAAGAITMGNSGSIDVGGANGSNTPSTGGGGGGGGSGSFGVYSRTSFDKGTGTYAIATGGNGGNGNGTSYDGGGGGGGGTGIICAPSFSNSGGTSATGGSGGTQGTSGTAGSAGTNGVITLLTQTPNLMIIGLHQDGRGLAPMIALERFKNPYAKEIHLNAKQHTSFMAAWYSKPGEFTHLCQAINHGASQQEVDQTCAVPIDRGGASELGYDEASPFTGNDTCVIDALEALPVG